MEPVEEFVISDVDMLKLITHPLRLQLLGQFKRARTVKETAAELDVAPTKLYYHVNLLEEKGLLRVVDTQIVSGIIEKRYQVAARRYRVDDNMLSGGAEDERFDALVGSFFQMAHDEIRQSMRAGLVDLRDRSKPHHGTLARLDFCLTAEQAEGLYGRLEAVIEEYQALSTVNEADEAGQAYALTLTFFPVRTTPSAQ
jgi:predicted ArsR family transcriptional regulator